MASEQKVVAALGRPFTLGMLYDAHRDELVTGFTLWDRKSLEERTDVHAQHSSAFEVTTSDSLESKSSLLDVDASLKASFMSGLIEVEGSAQYLNDQKKFHNQSRVTLQYKVTTTFEQLSMTEEEAKAKLNATGPATHVVTAVLYGANAFFVFDSDRLDASSVQSISGSMRALIKKIPWVDVDGKVDIKLTEEEKDLTNRFSCKFIGDFILPSNPSTFEEAVQAYVGLPKLLGQNLDTVVPLQVWLTPLNKFSSTAAELKANKFSSTAAELKANKFSSTAAELKANKFSSTAAELKANVSPAVMRKAERTIEDINQAVMRCNDSLDDDVVQNVPPVLEKLQKFKRNCEEYKSQLQQTMKKDVPQIRKGQEENVSLPKFLYVKETSPFCHDELNNWLKHREREINVIRSCVEQTTRAPTPNPNPPPNPNSNVKMVPHQAGVDREILDPGAAHALCFVFTSVKPDDPYLDQMDQYLDSHAPDGENVLQAEEEPWYDSDEVLHQMRAKAAAFHAVANCQKNNSAVRFLVATESNQKYPGATIYHYKAGVLENEDFTQYSSPDMNTDTDRDDFLWYAVDLTMDPNTANDLLTLSEGNKVATYGESQKYVDLPQRFDKQPQVLCTKRLTGRHYWEVDWGDSYDEVAVGVTYKEIGRKGDGAETQLGQNKESWCFSLNGGSFTACHNGAVWSDPQIYECSRVGVYLDWPGGVLSFYDATSNPLKHFYQFPTTSFSEAVYPAFRLSEASSVKLCTP